MPHQNKDGTAAGDRQAWLVGLNGEIRHGADIHCQGQLKMFNGTPIPEMASGVPRAEEPSAKDQVGHKQEQGQCTGGNIGTPIRIINEWANGKQSRDPKTQGCPW
ncbi:hypothetical protein V2G26_015019 [Clonostachys chloroleuca]